jgi:CBS domain containing-hemolysin-like protein
MMFNVGLAVTFALGLALFALHVAVVALARALRTYSRSRLEELCETRGVAPCADEITREDEPVERSAEAMAVLTGLFLVALLVVLVDRAAPGLRVELVIGIAVTVAAGGYLLAGIIGRVYPEPYLVAAWPFARLVRRVMLPFTTVTRAIEAFAYRRSAQADAPPRPQSVEIEIPHTDDEEEDLENELPESARHMMEKVIELGRQHAYELMTPRSAMLTLPATVSAAQAARAFIDSGYSRIPLFGETRDDIVGILYAKDLFAAFNSAAGPAGTPRKLAREPLYIPETKNAAELLDELRSTRVQLAVVLDEYGGVAGLITLEDLLEELVGEINDEHDQPGPADPVVPLGDDSYEVDASIPLEDLNERLDLRLPTDEDYATLGGLAFTTLGHLPEPGASFTREGVEFTVLHVEGRSIRRLRLNLARDAS